MDYSNEVNYLSDDEKDGLSDLLLNQDKIVKEIEAISDVNLRHKVLELIKAIDRNQDYEIKELQKKSSTSTLFTGLNAASLYTSMAFNQFIQTPVGVMPMLRDIQLLKANYHIDLDEQFRMLFYEKLKVIVTEYLDDISATNTNNANLLKNIVIWNSNNEKSRWLMSSLLSSIKNHPRHDNTKIMDVLVILFQIDSRFDDIKDCYQDLFESPITNEQSVISNIDNNTSNELSLADLLPDFLVTFLRGLLSKYSHARFKIEEKITDSNLDDNQILLEKAIEQKLKDAKINNKEYLLCDLAIANELIKGLDNGNWYNLCQRLTSDTCTYIQPKRGILNSDMKKNFQYSDALKIKSKLEMTNSPQKLLRNIYNEIQILKKSKVVSVNIFNQLEDALNSLKIPMKPGVFIDFSSNRDSFTIIRELLSVNQDLQSILGLILLLSNIEVSDEMISNMSRYRDELQIIVDQHWNSESNIFIVPPINMENN